MKKGLCILVLCALLVQLAGCGGGDVSSVQIGDWKPSEVYSDAEVEAAMQAVKTYFRQEFEGCTLTRLSYSEDLEEFADWAEQCEADEAIVILSAFTVDANGGDGSLEPNGTYEDYKWVLVRSDGGSWEHRTHGYG